MSAIEPVRCTGCQAAIPPDARFCPDCGLHVPVRAAPAQPAAPAPESAEPPGAKGTHRDPAAPSTLSERLSAALQPEPPAHVEQTAKTLTRGALVDGKYEVQERLGVGGFGEVFRVRHKTLQRDLALKTLHPVLASNEGMRGRFFREARVLMDLSHSSLVAMHDAGEWHGHLYMVMAYCPGETLAGMLRKRGWFPGLDAIAITLPILDALEYAHGRGVVHRDLKPANIVVTQRSDGAWDVKLLDFGVAKVLHDAGSGEGAVATLTAAGMTVGTLAYMSPEQAQGADIDRRADVYSMGVILYQMVTGIRPFEAENHSQLYRKILLEPPAPFAASGAPDEPAGVEAVIKRSLGKKREERFASALEMHEALAVLVGGASGGRGR
ncbi:MAG: protein kinase [Planctomycetes bacterium]|nr:protein kinase [Planctomycetota bacterium]